jgi:hypothetical protein
MNLDIIVSFLMRSRRAGANKATSLKRRGAMSQSRLNQIPDRLGALGINKERTDGEHDGDGSGAGAGIGGDGGTGATCGAGAGEAADATVPSRGRRDAIDLLETPATSWTALDEDPTEPRARHFADGSPASSFGPRLR